MITTLALISSLVLQGSGPAALAGIQEAKLSAPVLHSSGLGTSVSIYGNTAVLGAPRDNGNAPKSGAAYVFERSGLTWNLVTKLRASNSTFFDAFGASVSVSADTILVGTQAYLADKAYVFVGSGSQWTERAILPSDADSVSISGQTALLGGPVNFTGIGAANVYVGAGAQWNLEATLLSSSGFIYDFFGASVSLAGDTALIGARGDGEVAVHAGAAHVFERSGSVWNKQAKLLAPDGATMDVFGSSVSVSGERAMVGAPMDDDGGQDSGSVYVFARTASTWNFEAKLVASDAGPLAQFGHSLSLSGDTALVGAPGDDQNGADSGAVYVFERGASGWIEHTKLLSADGGAGDRLGFSVAYADDSALAGAPLAPEQGISKGAAYNFRVLETPVTYCTPKLNSLGCAPLISQSGIPSASADSGFLVTATQVRNRKPGLLLYTLDGPAALPFQGGTLCVVPPIRRTPARNSAGSPPTLQDCSGGYRMDMNAFAAGLIGGTPRPELRVSGTAVHCQWWGRDPGAVAGSSLTDALEYRIVL